MSSAQMISDIIERIGWGRYNVYLLTTMSLTCMLIFYGAALGSITIKEAQDEWHIGDFLLSQLGTSQLSGLFIGSFIWGYIANQYGRVLVLRICLGISMLTFLLYSFSVNFFMALVIIFVQGFGFAGMLSTASPTYFECCPPKQAWTTVLISWSLCLGLILANLVAFITVLSGDGGISRWRWVSGVGFVLSLATLITSFWLLESPRFLNLLGKVDKAQIVLKKIASWNSSSESGKLDVPIMTIASNHTEEIEESVITDLVKPPENVSFFELFSIHHIRKSISLAMVRHTQIGFLGDLGYFGLIEFMPYFLSNIPEKVTNDAQIYGTILIQISLGSSGTILASRMIDSRFGRKWTMIISYLCCGVCTFLFLIANSYWLILASTVLIYFFDYLGFAAFFIIIPENYPTNIRAVGQAWVNAVSKFGGVCAPFTLGLLVRTPNGVVIGIVLISISFGLVGVFGLMVKETKGKKMDSRTLSDAVKEY